MAKVTVIGGHGKVALLAEPLLVAAGHEVTAWIRRPEHAAQVAATGAEPVEFSVEDADVAAMVARLAGQDVVVWSAGAGGGSPARTYAVDRDAAIRSMRAAARAGANRYVMVSYLGAGPSHGVASDNSFFAYAEAKTAADAALSRSPLAWTILRPGRLTDGPPLHALIVGPAAAGGSVRRADVAAAIGWSVDHPDSAGRIIEFNNGDVPLAEALAE